MEILIAVLVFFGIAGWSDAAIANTQKNPEKAGHELAVLVEKANRADALLFENKRLEAVNEILSFENDELRNRNQKYNEETEALKNQNEKLSQEAVFWKNVSDELASMFSGIVSQAFQREAELSSKVKELETDNKALFNLAQMAGPLAVKVREKEKDIKLREFFIKHLEARVIEADILYNYWRDKAEERHQENVKLHGELGDLGESLNAAKNDSDFKNKLFVGLLLLFFGAVALAVLMRLKLESAYKQHEPEPGPSRGDVPPVI